MRSMTMDLRWALTAAALLLALGPVAAWAEQPIHGNDDDGDHSNQDRGGPVVGKVGGEGKPGAPGGAGLPADLPEQPADLAPLSFDGMLFPDTDDPMGTLGMLDFSHALPVLSDDLDLLSPGSYDLDGAAAEGGLRFRLNVGSEPDVIRGGDGGLPAPVPEPGPLMLLLLGGVLAAARRRG
jgi:hypothetical protein